MDDDDDEEEEEEEEEEEDVSLLVHPGTSETCSGRHSNLPVQ